jgi:magnesium-transporting ATPase (P-type)
MDLRYRGAKALAERFLASYARESDDYDLYSVVDYFIGYRAGVRAKVAALAARDSAIAPGQRARAAESAQARPAGSPTDREVSMTTAMEQSTQRGLSGAEAKARLKRYGLNTRPEKPPKPTWQRFSHSSAVRSFTSFCSASTR